MFKIFKDFENLNFLLFKEMQNSLFDKMRGWMINGYLTKLNIINSNLKVNELSDLNKEFDKGILIIRKIRRN